MSPRVAFTHNYPMGLSRERHRQGRYPGQHLYGADWLERAGWHVDFVPWHPPGLTTRLSGWLGLRYGDLPQERRVLAALRHADVVYAGEPHHVAGLARLRRRRLLRTPLVGVVHQSPREQDAAWLAGLDAVICLSSRVAADVDRLRPRDARPARTLAWGPDLAFPGYAGADSAEYVLSAGKVNRDVATLLQALDAVPGAAKVYAFGDLPPVPQERVQIVTTDRHLDEGGVGPPQFAYDDVLADMRGASVIAVPLQDPDCLSGLTEVADALGLGKPLVMTRTPYLDLDIEALGLGRWVAPGDAAGWATALAEIVTDPPLRRSMGERASAVARERWNAEIFGRGVSEVLTDVLPLRRRG